MNEYSETPERIHNFSGGTIYSFVREREEDADQNTIDSFGSEWNKFHIFSDEEIEDSGRIYFDLLDDAAVGKDALALDIGCGSGRFTKYISPRVAFVEAIEPSEAVFTSASFLHSTPNVRVTRANISRIPFPDNSFDFVFCLGVLHHVTDTRGSLHKCIAKLKPGGYFLIYLYYNLENRGPFYRFLFSVTNLCRMIICRLPSPIKMFLCDMISALVYLPLAILARGMRMLPGMGALAKYLPLYFYHDKTYRIMRNDALDRFGTPLEKRYSKEDVLQLLRGAGLKDIKFSPNMPYWHVIARK